MCIRDSKSVVYRLKRNGCGNKYVGSTFRVLHQRVKEHLTKEGGSVYTHQQACGAPFTVKIMVRETNRVALQFTEAFIIIEEAAFINSRAERKSSKT